MSNEYVQQQPAITSLKCYVIDDEQPAINRLAHYIGSTPGLEFIGSETDPMKAQVMLSSSPSLPDILFLDIEMRGVSGMKLAEMVMNKTQVIFTTGHSQFAADAYRVNAADYLLKPVSHHQFLEAVAKARASIIKLIPDAGAVVRMLFLKDSLTNQTHNINQNEIVYIKSIGNYSIVYLIDNSKVMHHMLLKRLQLQLWGERFVRIHKSYVININHIKFYQKNGTVELINDIKLQVGRTYRKNLKENIRKAHGS